MTAPVAIGGVGGAGTRVGAAVLQALGFDIGDDLNEALDNLWFTLLFKEPGVLAASEEAFQQRCALFWARMSGRRALTSDERELARRLARSPHFEHSPRWLAARARALVAHPRGTPSPVGWGWKEPNTSLVVGRLLSFDPGLRYIHFLRDPFAMATSRNRNQPRNWGRALLGRDVEDGPRGSLAYWCAAHRRIGEEITRWPRERLLVVNYEALCDRPEEGCARIATFVGASPEPDARRRLGALVARPERAMVPLTAADFDAADLEYLISAGYDVDRSLSARQT